MPIFVSTDKIDMEYLNIFHDGVHRADDGRMCDMLPSRWDLNRTTTVIYREIPCWWKCSLKVLLFDVACVKNAVAYGY